MDGVAETIYQIIRQVIRYRDSEADGVHVSDATRLYEAPDGLGLDSLEIAALSAGLEGRFGHDPYTAGVFPQTFGELVSYYSAGKT